MKIAIKENEIFLKEIDSFQYERIKSWGKLRWDKATQCLRGTADRELLNKLAMMFTLPENIEERRKKLNDIMAAVDRERLNPDPVPLIAPPVKVKLFAHQIRGYNMALLTLGLLETENQEESKGFGFLFEMGCGKTLTAIATVGTAYQLGKIEKVLIAAPTSVCAVWEKEFLEFANFPVTVKVLLGDKAKRLKALKELEKLPQTALKVAVINYESTWRDGIFESLVDYDADFIICDESQRIKTHDAEQSKALHKLGDKARFKLILSGTPVQNHAIDLFSQYRFLDHTVFGTNFYQFRSKYAVMGGFNDKQIVGYQNLEDLIQKEYSIAYRVTKEEALDLPEQVFQKRFVFFSPKERRIYEKLQRDSFLELSNGGTVTASTVLTKLLRLQQFTGGFLAMDNFEKPQLVSKEKLNALEEILEDYVLGEGKKLVIFARFRPEIDLIKELLQKKKIPYGAIYGDVKMDNRSHVVRDFQENPKTKVFVAQIDTAGLGITLTAADTCVYYSVNFNYATYSQSLARIHRIGQKNTCTYIHLMAAGTVDELVLQALAKKENLAKVVVDNWQQFFK